MSCVSPDPANTVTDRIEQLLTTGGNGYVLSLCPGRQYFITQPINFTAPNQEISTQGYPTGSDRATLVVSGPVFNGTGHTTAVDGTCSTCSGLKLRNVQVCLYQREPPRFNNAEKRLPDQRDEGRRPTYCGRRQHRDGRRQHWAIGARISQILDSWS